MLPLSDRREPDSASPMSQKLERLFPSPPGGRVLSRELAGGVTTFAALFAVQYALLS
jgi:hypothetical protein